MKTSASVTGILALLVAFGSVHCAYLEQDYGTKTGPDIRPPIRIVPPPSRNEVTSLIGRITVGRPYRERNMTVFPLYLSREEDPYRYVTLDEAVNKRYLKIYEKGAATVSRIDVENVSDHYVFLMAGEILGGGKQNRVISKDVLLRSRSGVVSVPVYCIERHRWVSKGSLDLSSGKTVAPNSIRMLTQKGASQSDVWKEVATISKANKVKSSTANFQEVYEDREVRRRIAFYDPLIRMPRRTVGAVIVVNDRIAGAEIFCNAELFDDLWSKVLRSYSLEAISYPKPMHRSYRHPIPRVTSDDVRRYLARVHRARFTEERGVDSGHFLNLSGSGIYGKALIFRRAVIHLNLAGRGRVILER